jgi:hypothetical protein
LGSLGKQHDGTTWASRYEQEHLEEEIGIIMKALGEYTRDVYTRQINDISQYKEEYRDMMQEYNEKMVASIRDAAPKLIDTARNNMSQLGSDMPKVVTDVAILTYQLLIVLSESLLKSLENWDETKQIPDHMNAYKDAGLQSVASKLNNAISTMIQELSQPHVKDAAHSPEDILEFSLQLQAQLTKLVNGVGAIPANDVFNMFAQGGAPISREAFDFIVEGLVEAGSFSLVGGMLMSNEIAQKD